MTRFNHQTPQPFHPQGQHAAPAMQNPLNPAREIHQINRKRFTDGTEAIWLHHITTDSTGARFETWDVLEAPPTVCGHTPNSPDDLVQCQRCLGKYTLSCGHAQSCNWCGVIVCNHCWKTVTLPSMRHVVVCRESCCDELQDAIAEANATGLVKAWLKLKQGIRGVFS